MKNHVCRICVLSLTILLFGLPAFKSFGADTVGFNRYGQAILSRNAGSLNLISVPSVRQSTDYTCGVACVQSLLWYAGLDYRQDRLAEALGSAEENGTDLQNIRKLFEREYQDLYKTVYREGLTLEDLDRILKEGKPVLCAIQAWSGEVGKDYSSEWQCGHYVIAVGSDRENVYFMDPSICGNYSFIPRDEFEVRWHDSDGTKHYVHAGLVMEPVVVNYDPSQILKTD